MMDMLRTESKAPIFWLTYSLSSNLNSVTNYLN